GGSPLAAPGPGSPVTRLLAITGTRADLGLWRPILAEVARREGVEPRLLITAMHLDQRFGFTAREARNLGVPIAAEVPSTPTGDSRREMAEAIGQAIVGMGRAIEDAAPDWLLVLGDRGEQLAAAIVALHSEVRVAHLHGGEQTTGAVDDVVRDLISRAADLHLVATTAAADRLRALGAPQNRVVVTGAPGLDAIAGRNTHAEGEVRARHGVADSEYLMVVYHPETVGDRDPAAGLAAVMAGVATSGIPAIAIGSNADAGGRAILNRLLRSTAAFLEVVPSLPHADYVALLAGTAAIVGNSSSGLIEAPLLRVPAVNVGERQAGRTQGDNVINVLHDPAAIEEAIAIAVDPRFRQALSGTSPYGDGHAAPRILDAILATAGGRLPWGATQ
ncbi:MAG: UDP-N-acetylglucosamine 2-epimerase, partial [Dehalococcoidia bacterium]